MIIPWGAGVVLEAEGSGEDHFDLFWDFSVVAPPLKNLHLKAIFYSKEK